MKILNTDNCIKQCSCGCLFSYDKNDVQSDTEQYWVGFWKGGWETRRYRYVACPVCGKYIVIK